MNIQTRFKSIPELYQYTNFVPGAQDIDFDIVNFSDIHSSTKKMVAPHRRDFYTIIFFEDQRAGQISLNMEYIDGLQNTLTFHGPDHVFSFMRDDQVSGYVILFHPDFLSNYYSFLDDRFPFFSIFNQNVFHLSDAELESFKYITTSLFLEKKNLEVVKPLLAAFLQKSTLLFDQYHHEEQFLSTKSLVLRKFKSLISNHFTKSKNVDYYAKLLAVSASYLNEVSKSETGKTSKQLIMQRILLEAENLLKHTDLDVAEIADILNFSEPTHFVRFFKKETGATPNTYRSK